MQWYDTGFVGMIFTLLLVTFILWNINRTERKKKDLFIRRIPGLNAIDDAIGPLILKNADAQTVKRVAISQGMDTMRDDGARKVLKGMTTVEEVLAATQEDVIVDE